MFKADYFINNRRSLLANVKDSTIVVAGNGLIQKNSDNPYKFRQDSNFYYLTGISEPNLFLILDSKNNEYICYKKKSDIAILFDGDYRFSEMANTSGINNFIEYSDAFKLLKQTNNKIYFNLPNKNTNGYYFNPHRRFILDRLKRIGIIPKDIRPILANLRSIKQPQEITQIRKLVNITKQTISLVTKDLDYANNENDILIKINQEFIKHNVEHGYEPMVSAGKNTTTAHYSLNSSKINNGDLILLDVGAEANLFTADISRTFVKGDSIFYETLIKDVSNIQLELIKMLKPGIFFKDIQQKATDLIFNMLLRHELVKTKKEAQKVFPYAIGHFLGLDVHDVGNYKDPIKPNMILTIEPGIHIPEKNIGIRIEDDILITEKGYEIL